MTLFSSVPYLIGCFVLVSRQCVAVDNTKTSLSQKQAAAFIFTRHPLKSRSSNNGHATFQLQAQTQSTKGDPLFPVFELMKDAALGKKNNNGDIESVQDFDADLANEIEEALMSVSVGGNNDKGKVFDIAGGNDDNNKNTISKGVDEPTREINEQITPPPVQKKIPQYVPELPPHTALAQVVANQYGFKLIDVSPAGGTGSRITAEDVEYHAWKVLQPPCTREALELAHSLDLDLNFLYDDEDREYVMELSDIQLYEENIGSLKMASQTKKGVQIDNDAESSRKRMKKISALDKRMEQNTGKLFEKAMKFAGTVTGGIVQQVQQIQQAVGSEILREVGIFDDTNGKSAEDIKTVEDFDADLASEIQAALAGIDFDDEDGDDSAVEPSPVDFTKEELNIKTVEDVDADLASEIPTVLSSVDSRDENGDDSAVEPSQDREYVMDEENIGSLKMTSQTKEGEQIYNDAERMKKISALDKRMEQNTGKLFEKAMKFAETVTGGIAKQVQQVQQAVGSEILREVGIFDDTNGKSAEDIKTVEDFDADLASEIQAALAGIDVDDEDGNDIAVEPSPVDFTKEELNIKTVEDVDADLAGEIQTASIDSHDKNSDDSAVEPSPAGFTKEELKSLTCVHLKELLRQRGMKVSGKKAELVNRLLDAGDDNKSDSSLFFAKLQ